MEWLFFFALRGKDDNELQIFFSLFRQNCLYPVAFTFIAYETADKGLHLESSDAANGYWTLTQKNDKGETLSYKFELCPFFANAYTVVEKPDTGAAGGAAKIRFPTRCAPSRSCNISTGAMPRTS